MRKFSGIILLEADQCAQVKSYLAAYWYPALEGRETLSDKGMKSEPRVGRGLAG